MLNLFWCLILFFIFLQFMIRRLEFSASIQENVGLVVIFLESEMEKWVGIYLNLVYDNRAFAGETAGFICKPLMNDLTRGTKRDCSSVSLIIFGLRLHDDSQYLVISAHLSTVLLSSRSLIQFPHGPLGLVQLHGHRLTLNCHLTNRCYWSPKTEPQTVNE